MRNGDIGREEEYSTQRRKETPYTLIVIQKASYSTKSIIKHQKTFANSIKLGRSYIRGTTTGLLYGARYEYGNYFDQSQNTARHGTV